MVCKLCQQEKTLRDSHIIPKFITTWLKDSGNGYLRNVVNINVRIQDGVKQKMLCDGCENRFSDCEGYFAKSIFYPHVNDRADSFEYTEKLYYFTISLAWRVLHVYIDSVHEQPLRDELLRAEREWREFLLEKKPVLNFNRIHLMTGVDVMSQDYVRLPERFIQYIGRGIDMDIPSTDEDALIYIKLPRFIFMIPLFGLQSEEFINTAITVGKGIYRCNDAQIKGNLGKYLLSRVETMNQLRENISPIQRQKMHQVSIDSWPDVKDKDLGIILEYQNRF